MITRHELLISTLLMLSWSLAWLVLMPGLTGSFLFDDFPNLEMIGAFGPINNWELFKTFVFGGVAGPLGRPIALASFLLNANDWPADIESFKYTNILIHILISAILFPTLRKLLHSIGRSSQEADWLALIASTLWLLNPFFVSTTLYVVQRMTQLAALFSVIGIWAYLAARPLLSIKPLYGYLYLSLSVIIGTLLAAYSKENGILLPLLILTIEFSLYDHWTTSHPDWRWKAIFLGIPTAIIIIYLLTFIPSATEHLQYRNFTVAQRLLTEPRIIWEYLFYLLVPHIQTRGLYHDGIAISTSLLSPWTTLPAILGIFTLAIMGWLSRHKWPLVSLAILFFLGGHLLESTASTLELYFEHRNYLPAIFLFLPIATVITRLWLKLKLILALCITFTLCGSYAFATRLYSELWGDENQLMLVWAKANPDSARAQNSAVQAWERMGRLDIAISLLEESVKRMPNSGLLATNLLAYKARYEMLSADEFQEAAARLRQQPFDAQVLRALNYLVITFNSRAPQPKHTTIMMSLLAGIRDDLQGRVPIVHRYTYYLQGLLMSGQGDGQSAYYYFSQELAYTKNLETSLNMIGVLASNNHFTQALGILGQSERLLEIQPESKFKRPRHTYRQEITRLRTVLLNDILNANDKITDNKEPKTIYHPAYEVDISPKP